MINCFSQIDYIIIPNKLKHILLDARVYCNTEASSDHRMLVARLDLRPFRIFQKPRTGQGQVKFNTQKLCNDEETKRKYQADLLENLQSTPEVRHSRWERVEKNVLKTAETTLGHQAKLRKDKRIHSDKIEEMSIESKNIRINMMNTKDPLKYSELKKERNKVSHKIRTQIKLEHEDRIRSIVSQIGEAGRAGQSHGMFSAVKELYRKPQKQITVLDKDGKVVVAPAEIYKEISSHYKNHFNHPTHQAIERYIGEPSPLDDPIRTDEVTKSLSSMSNNRAAYDSLSAELLKYAPIEVHSEIAKALNEMLEEHADIDIGAGKIAAIEKPKKPMPGPLKICARSLC